MLFFLILLLTCTHLHISSADICPFEIPLRIENALPSFLTPSYYRQMINDGYSWADQNKKDIFATAAITSIVHLAFGKRAGSAVLGAGVTRLWFKAEIEKIKQDQTRHNQQEKDENRELAKRLNAISDKVGTMQNESAKTKEVLDKYGTSIASLERGLSSLDEKTLGLQTKVQENSIHISSIDSKLTPITASLSKANQSLVDVIEERKKQNQTLEEIQEKINSLRTEMKVITAESAHHIMTETRKIICDHSYSPQKFDSNETIRLWYEKFPAMRAAQASHHNQLYQQQ